ncbi:MAG TPA: anhydro-N-acetylmuramic acid kinase [Cyclobacteriaceae bacterium]|nr:anhydro-N-acetylmuramic acid kinase [Cyclobacteriaceae bacterium]
MESPVKYKVIGLMSGTSLDGVDLVCCTLKLREGKWVYVVEATQTVRYSPLWKQKLAGAQHLSGEALMLLDIEYGKYLGVLVEAFVMKNRLRGVKFIASHGHTIFHQPVRNFTFQLGNGNALHAATGFPIACDFRSLDVALDGQGAPLVPIGDRELFGEYDICLNLGGIANLSMDSGHKRIAYDICFANMGLNDLASKAGIPFDKNGTLAADGVLDQLMLGDLKSAYEKFRKKRPSLSFELYQKVIKPILDRDHLSVKDRLTTFVESIAHEISIAIPRTNKQLTMLCTGGGAFNSYLMYRLVEMCEDRISIIIPDENVVKFKEAIVFAFLGVLRVRNEINCLKSVTGAKRDNSGGILIGF